MYIDYPTLGKVIRTSYRPSALTWRRLLWTNSTLSLYGTTQLINGLGEALDSVLHPGIDQQPVDSPVYITAAPRSGTTYLHKLMALDPRFTTFKLYQTLFPSVTVERVAAALRSYSQEHPKLRQVRQRVDRLFAGWENQHHIGIDENEEDEALWVLAMATPALWIMFPFPDELHSLVFIDKWPPERRQKLAEFVRHCIQAHMYARAQPGQTLLAKSVLLSSRFDTLLQATPEARFIYLVRHPYETLPSAVSLLTAPWKSYCPEIPQDSETYRAWSDMFIEHQLHLHDKMQSLPQERVVTVLYSQLLRHPMKQIERIYRHFGWEMTPQYTAELAAELERAKRFRSRHRYTLKQFGLNRADIYKRLLEIFKAYHFSP